MKTFTRLYKVYKEYIRILTKKGHPTIIKYMRVANILP